MDKCLVACNIAILEYLVDCYITLLKYLVDCYITMECLGGCLYYHRLVNDKRPWSIATIATVVWIEGLSDLVACRFLLAC